MNEFGQKGVVPLAERLSLSPEEANALTGIGLTSIAGGSERRAEGAQARDADHHPPG
jgi:hypothetical protein